MHHRYVIIGGGLAAAHAIAGIRSRDTEGSILLISRENHRPYNRPPLTKDVWFGTYDMERLPVFPDAFYDDNHVALQLRREVLEVDAENKVLWDDRGESAGYDHLLFATGCRPKRLFAQGSELSSVRYFRDLEDYLDLEARLGRIQHITIVGGGFTAVEMSAALRAREKEVTLVLPEEYPLRRMLPRDLGEGVLEYLRDLGVEVVSDETIVHIDEDGGFVHARTQNGNDLTTQLVLVDQGGEPQSGLAEAAGLDIDDGIVVNEYGEGSRAGTWAAGDVAEFPYLALGQLMRVEGSDHAERHGRLVGANMAGAREVYTHLPLKWFRLGDLQFEGVGELNARLDTETVWLEPGRESVTFYLRDDIVRGVMLCNVHDRLDWARALVQDARVMSATERAALVTQKV
jgi:NADPH-dependent 2,4-dienoyl-CoA reductase/sulfur reductase-like enzyme